MAAALWGLSLLSAGSERRAGVGPVLEAIDGNSSSIRTIETGSSLSEVVFERPGGEFHPSTRIAISVWTLCPTEFVLGRLRFGTGPSQEGICCLKAF